MIIAQRSAMVGNGLPYDSKVEYLESNKSQYINTEVIYSRGQDFTVNVDVEFVKVNQTGIALFGASSIGPRFWLGLQNQGVGFAIGGGGGVVFADFPTGFSPLTRFSMLYSLWDSWRRLIVNGSNVWSGGLQNVPNLPIWLFGSCRGPGQETTLSYSSMVRIYACSFSQNNDLVRDFIPVRVGTTGFLYDRANPTGGPLGNGLYPNSGTGSFVIGPDVSTSFVGGGRKCVAFHRLHQFRHIFRRLFEERRAA